MAKLHESKAWLMQRYQIEHKHIDDIAKEAGVQPLTIRRALEKHGLLRKRT